MKKHRILSAALSAALSLSLLTPAMATELPANDPPKHFMTWVFSTAQAWTRTASLSTI